MPSHVKCGMQTQPEALYNFIFMKKILLLMFSFFGNIGLSYSQAIDTVKTYSFGKMPPIYGEDKLYWERNYDDKNHLSFEGLRYNDCFTGPFINYWENGKVKTKGQYLPNTTRDWTKLQERGLCSVETGEWKSYDETGKYTSSVFYTNGKMVATPPIDTVSTTNYGKMPPVFFANKVYWERNYDDRHHLLFEALKYNTCFIGPYFAYWDNGNIKTRGQYVENTSGDWTNLKTRGLCSVQDGVWKNYNETGQVSKTIIYDKGTIIKED